MAVRAQNRHRAEDSLFGRRFLPHSLALLALLSLLISQAASVAPHWHDHLHEESEDKEHSCLVTVIAQGQVLLADPAISIPLPAGHSISERIMPLLRTGCHDVRSPFGRGPPSLLA